MESNPFSYGNPITCPNLFIGRQEETQQIARRILSHESTSLVGERRMGKTSLLMHLADRQVASSLGLNPDSFCLVHIDLEGATKITPMRFWEVVFTPLLRTVQKDAIKNAVQDLLHKPSFDIFYLDDLFEVVRSEGIHLVLLLDEFESVTLNTNFDFEFFGGVRSLAIRKPLSLVTATQNSLEDLCHSEKIKSSPFFNIFSTVVLRPFNEVESEALIDAALSKSRVSLSTREKELILTLGGRHPFFLQMAGYIVFEEKCSDFIYQDLKYRAIQRFDQQARPHFDFLWKQCSESQKISLLVMYLLGQQKDVPAEGPAFENITRAYGRASHDLDALIKRGLVIESSGRYRVFSPRLGVWLSSELKALPEQDGDDPTVNSWFQSGKTRDINGTRSFLNKFNEKYWPLLLTCIEQLSLGVAGNALYQLLVERLLR